MLFPSNRVCIFSITDATQKRDSGGDSLDALNLQQVSLPVQAAAEAAQAAASGKHPVAGNEQWQRVGAAGAANRATCLGPAEGSGDLAITAGLASRNGLQLTPNALLKRCAPG